VLLGLTQAGIGIVKTHQPSEKETLWANAGSRLT
jgi:hypothetical protein